MRVKLKAYNLIYEGYQVKELGWTFDPETRELNGDEPVPIGDWIITTEELSMFVVHALEFEKTFERVGEVNDG